VIVEVAWLASGLVFCAFFMKTMVPLRVVAIASNFAFIGYSLLGIHYGIFEKVFPILVLHAALLPLNIIRLRQMQHLLGRIREGPGDAVEVLLPYMKKETHAKGETLFQRGDAAEKIYLIDKGVVAIPEVAKRLAAGTVFGEVGIFSADAKRSASAVCAEACDIYSIHRDKVLELFYQNPKFGLFIIRLVSRYATESVDAKVQSGSQPQTSS
jgi:hypothetical protein